VFILSGGNPTPSDIEECVARLRVLLSDGKLQADSAHSAQRIKNTLVAQLEEHNFHLQHNLHMRDTVVELLQKWQRRFEPGKFYLLSQLFNAEC